MPFYKSKITGKKSMLEKSFFFTSSNKKKNHSIVLSALFCFSMDCYDDNRKNNIFLEDFSNMPREEFFEVHKSYFEFFTQQEKDTVYQEFIKSDYSNLLQELMQIFSNVILANSYAANSRSCLFGGWISFRRNGRCKTPWNKSVRDDVSRSNTNSYTACGASHLFRCNPVIFGPGPDEAQMRTLDLDGGNSGVEWRHNPAGGICVNTGGTYRDLSKRCAEMSKKLDEARGKPWIKDLSDEDFKTFYDHFTDYQNYVNDICKRKKTDTCLALENNLRNIKNRYERQSRTEAYMNLANCPPPSSTVEQVLGMKSVVEDSARSPSSVDDEYCSGIVDDEDGIDTENWINNCKRLLENSDIPTDALKYALNVMKINASSFRSDKCYGMLENSDHYSMGGMTKDKFEKLMENGLRNKCQFVINDTRARRNCRGSLYYIDLCKPQSHSSYFNMGVGTCLEGRRFANEPGKKTTLLGAFFTSNEHFNFRGSNPERYADIRKTEGEVASLQLFGLQESNNGASEQLKYMHVSPYKSSWGCPSVGQDDSWVVRTLARNGPSLVLNYGDNMEDIDKCTQ